MDKKIAGWMLSRKFWGVRGTLVALVWFCELPPFWFVLVSNVLKAEAVVSCT